MDIFLIITGALGIMTSIFIFKTKNNIEELKKNGCVILLGVLCLIAHLVLMIFYNLHMLLTNPVISKWIWIFGFIYYLIMLADLIIFKGKITNRIVDKIVVYVFIALLIYLKIQ